MAGQVTWILVLFVGCVFLPSELHGAAVSRQELLERTKRQANTGIEAGLIHQIADDIGPGKEVDLILLLDRSHGIGLSFFVQHLKSLARAILAQYSTLHPDYVRLAVVTFAIDVTTPIDCISTVADSCTKCQILEGDVPQFGYEVIYYSGDISKGTNANGAFQEAADILARGRSNRPSAKQIILALTDGNYASQDDYDPFKLTRKLKDEDKVKIYSVVLGNWKQPGHVREMATNASYFGQLEDWENLVQDTLTSWGSDLSPLWTTVPSSMCTNCSQNSECMCDVITGQTNCTCAPGYEPDTNVDSLQCTECYWHAYKGDYGNHKCKQCAQGLVTQFQGSTSFADCECNVNSASCDTIDACDTNVCPPNKECSYPGNNTASCDSCAEGFEGFDCSNKNYCADNTHCQNGGKCVDRAQDLYACVCPFGYRGRHCEINIDDCQSADVTCQNNGTCEDRNNGFFCDCVEGFLGSYCQEMKATVPPNTTTTTTTTAPTTTTTTSTTTPTTTKSTTTTEIPEEEGDNMLIIIIGACCGGLVLIIIIIAIIVYCVINKRRRQAVREATLAKNELARERAKRRSGSRFKTIRTIRDRFSGFWKRKSLRGAMGDYDKGVPSAPPQRRPDLIGEDISMVGTVDELRYHNEQIQDTSGMKGWTIYLEELQTGGMIKRGAIIEVDSGKGAKTEGFRYKQPETQNAKDIVEKGLANVPLFLHGSDFYIYDNDGTVAIGNTSGDATRPEVVVLSLTRKYVVIMIADDVGGDLDALKKEIVYISDHIKSEGY